MGVGAGLYMYDVVVKTFTFTVSSPDELILVELMYVHAFSLLRPVTSVCCSHGQTVGWIKIPLGREVDLGPRDTVKPYFTWFHVKIKSFQRISYPSCCHRLTVLYFTARVMLARS